MGQTTADRPLEICGEPRLHALEQSTLAMDTFVTVQVASVRPEPEVRAALTRALAWFAQVERVCNRFDRASELARLCGRPGEDVPVSALLYEALAFALAVADLTRGAFDPTVGGAQQARGFNRSYKTGEVVKAPAGAVTYRDLSLDPARRTVRLRKPLLLDLGAVAKGMAIDLAARELMHLERFAVDAGGDLYAGGADELLSEWRIGVDHPRGDGLLGVLTVQNQAVCSSDGGARPAGAGGEHHLLDPRAGRSPRTVAGVTVVAPSAMAADALSTAAFILGPAKGMRLLAAQAVHGLIVTATGEVRTTTNWEGALAWSVK